MKIVCFGDSNTYGFDPRSYFGDRLSREERWVDILADRLGCITVNAGENGREIPWNSWEVTEFKKMLAAEKPVDLLMIMLGTNDLLQGNSVPDIVKRMETFLLQIDLNRSDVLLIAPPVLRAGEWVTSGELVEASRKLSGVYERFADALGVKFVDAGEWNLSIAFDGVHLSPEGHRGFADGLLNYLRRGE